MPGRKRIGEILQARQGLLDELLNKALELQQVEPGTKLGVALVRIGAVTEEHVAEALAEQLSMDYVDPTDVKIDPACVWRVNRSLAERRLVFPIAKARGGGTLVAMADPQDHDAIRDLEFSLKGRVVPAVASPQRIRQAILRHYSVEAVASRLLQDVKPEMRELTVAPTFLELDAGKIQSHLQKGDSQVYVDLVDFLLINAIERGASDVHLEPQEDGIRVRYRIDGLLRETVQLPSWVQSSLIGRIKVIARMDVAEKRRPQDGKVSAQLGGRPIDLRVGTLPSQYGENVVIRILDPQMIKTNLADLGWPTHALTAWYRQLSTPRGMLLVVGPTGSGKSTTLYASIHRLNSENTSIVTIEDPIEYRLSGLTQVQVNEKAGITFASSVKAMLRQDPNVVVIGEIRDPETAAAAIDAAGTGHLVLSTLHTSNSVAAITRLLDLKVAPYLLADAMTGVVSQRLLRRVCPNCSVQTTPTPEEWERLGLPEIPMAQGARFAGPGCPTCQYMGYSGRFGCFELMPFTRELGAKIQSGAPEAELWQQALDDGLITLLQDALIKVREGWTTLEEVARTVPTSDYPKTVLQQVVQNLHGAWEPTGVFEEATHDEEPFDDVEIVARTPTPPEPSADELPTQPPELPPEPDPTDVPDSTVPPQPPKLEEIVIPEPVKKTGRPEVLIVDDAEEILQLVGLTLEDDCDIRTAGDGVEAVEAITAKVPDLVVLDVMMPRKTGYEVCTWLKSKPELEGIPVLMLSARGETAHVKKGFYAGADDYLPKPFDPEELLLRVKALLRRSGW